MGSYTPSGDGSRPSVGVSSTSYWRKNEPIRRASALAWSSPVEQLVCGHGTAVLHRGQRRRPRRCPGRARGPPPSPRRRRCARCRRPTRRSSRPGTAPTRTSAGPRPRRAPGPPAASRSRAVAAVTCGSSASPDHGCVQNATRSRPAGPRPPRGTAAPAARPGTGRPGAGPLRQSSSAAVSRTERVTMKCTAQPDSASAICGPQVMRPRDGLRPTDAAGGRRDPDRPAAVARRRDRHDPGADRRRGAAAGTAGHVVGAPRRAGAAHRQRLGRAHDPELGGRWYGRG